MSLDWKDIETAVGKAAPIIGTLVGGPAGAAVGALVASAIGVENTPDAVNAALLANPDAAVKLKQMESDEKVKLQTLVYQHADNMLAAETASIQADVTDRTSARSAAVQGGTAKPLFWLSLFLLALTIGTEIAVLFFGYPKTVSEIIVGRVLGLMDSVALMVLAFHYGSSSSSERKTELLAQSTPPAGPTK